MTDDIERELATGPLECQCAVPPEPGSHWPECPFNLTSIVAAWVREREVVCHEKTKMQSCCKAKVQLEELRVTIRDLISAEAEWPSHGNVPLAIAASFALQQGDARHARLLLQQVCDAEWNGALLASIIDDIRKYLAPRTPSAVAEAK